MSKNHPKNRNRGIGAVHHQTKDDLPGVVLMPKLTVDEVGDKITRALA